MTVDNFYPLFLLAFIVTVVARYIHLNNTDPIPYDKKEKGLKDLEEQKIQARNFCKQLGIEYRLEELNQTTEQALNFFYNLLDNNYYKENTDILSGQKKYLAKKENELFKVQRKLEDLRNIEGSGVEAKSIDKIKAVENEEEKITEILNDEDFQ